jgi:hypothetical protein
MLGRLKMSISQAITSYNRLMSDVFSDGKLVIVGNGEAFKSATLERGLNAITQGATGVEDERMLEQVQDSASCKV